MGDSSAVGDALTAGVVGVDVTVGVDVAVLVGVGVSVGVKVGVPPFVFANRLTVGTDMAELLFWLRLSGIVCRLVAPRPAPLTVYWTKFELPVVV